MAHPSLLLIPLQTRAIVQETRAAKEVPRFDRNGLYTTWLFSAKFFVIVVVALQ